MEDFIKVTAKTVEDAVLEASIQLGTTSDNIEYHILEKETRGFLGIGAKKALIEARRKVSEEEFINEVMREKEGKSEKSSRKKETDPEKKAGKKAEKKAGKETKKAEEKSSQKEEKTQKKEEKALKKEEKAAQKEEKGQKKEEKSAQKEGKAQKKEEKASQKAKKAERKAEKETVKEEKTVPETDAQSAAAPEKAREGSSENTPRLPADPELVKTRARDFLSQLLSAMGVESEIETSYEDGVLNVELKGEDMGILIGKRGQTLDSVQYLTSLVVNKGKAAYVRVKIDTENYRERRKATLENLAKNMAFKVKKTRRPAYLEPMNPYERRIIHSALQNDPYVTTHSEGEEPARKVVITLRKHEKEEAFEE